MTGSQTGLELNAIIAISLISAINPYLAVNLAKYCLKVDSLMQGLNAKQLLTISFFAALFNGLSHNLYFHLYIRESSILNCINMFIGDFVGSLIVLYTFALLIKWLRKSIKLQQT
jgi:hypothetical protein